jgi:tetratricopeptide (TPR) repeat protein
MLQAAKSPSMSSCPNCGHAFAASLSRPLSCPRCGKPLSPSLTPGEPPPFAGSSRNPSASMEAPILRVPKDSHHDLPELTDLGSGPLGGGRAAASSGRFPPVPPRAGSPVAGPPAASLDDDTVDSPFGPPAVGLDAPDPAPGFAEVPHGELELGDLGDPLELDLGTPGRSAAAPRPAAPSHPGTSSFGPPIAPPARPSAPSFGGPPAAPARPGAAPPRPAAAGFGPPAAPPIAAPSRPGAASPPVAAPRPPAAPSAGPGLRSPFAAPPPASPVSPFGFGPSASDDLDLPAPAGLDLPTPAVRAPGPRFAPARPGSPAPIDLDLPTPATSRGIVDLPAPIELDLPTPSQGRVDLPTPVGSNLLTPVAGQELRPTGSNLLTPVGSNLPQPAGSNLLTPVGSNLPQPAILDVAPKGGNELAPGDLPVPKHGSELQPIEAARAAAAAAGMAMPGGVPYGAPVPRAGAAGGSASPYASPEVAAPRVSKGMLIALGAIVVLGLGVVGVVYSGLLDPEDPEVATTRGGAKKDDGTPVAPPPGTLAAPSEAVLAELGKDRPSSYRAAIAAAAKAGDVVGEAEATILLHYRYGPDPELAKRAAALVQPIAGSEEPFVKRVVALAALAAGDTTTADTHLVGDDPRTRLYRGWLRLAQDKPADALAEAKAVLDALPSDLAALHLELAATAATDPSEAMEKLDAATEANPGHPRMHELAVITALELGRLGVARKHAAQIEPEDAPAAYGARVQSIQGRIAAAGGDYRGAIAKFEAAIAAVPGDMEAREGKIRALLAARELAEASAEASTLARDAKTLDAKLLEAEVAIASGEGDRALGILDGLKSVDADARVPFLRGQVHAARLQLEEARPLFAKAIEIDPGFFEASIADARLLADAHQVGEAIGVFDTARKRAADAGRPHAVAEILVAKADVLAKDGQTRAAIEALSQALEAEPEHNAAQARRGTMRLLAGERESGKADLVAVFERTGGWPGLAGPLGRIYVEDGELEKLETLVGEQLRGEDTAEDLMLVGARLRLAQGRTDDARELVSASLVKKPSDWEAHMLMSQVLIAEGDYAEALAEVERTPPPTPNAEHLLAHGKALEFNGKYDDAAPLISKALDLNADMHEARYLRGRKRAIDNAVADALADLEIVADAEAAKTAPWYPRVYFYIGVAKRAEMKLDDAAKAYKTATTLDDKDGEAWAEWGTLEYARNKHSVAITALQKAVDLGETDKPAWYFDALADLGRAQSKGGSKSAAKKTLEKFLAEAPADHTARDEAKRLAGSL